MNDLKAQAASYDDTVVRQFSIMAVVWGVGGMLVGVIIACQLAWPAFPGSAMAACGLCTPTR